MSSTVPTPSKPTSLEVSNRPPNDDWQILGETFEVMGKVGLALTVGFTAAAVFCRLADQRKLKVPAIQEVLQHLT